MERMDSDMLDKIENLGYEIESDNGEEYIISKDNTQYVITEKRKHVELKSIIKELSPQEGREVVDNVGRIILKPIDSENVEVTLEDTVLETFDNGKSMNVEESIGFVCGTDFEEDSIDPDDAVSVLGKAEKYYYEITTYWMSKQDLQELYMKGMEIVDEINE